jgi:hypothetical protein
MRGKGIGCPPAKDAWAAAGPAQGRIERGQLAADTAGMAKEPEPPHLFWLTYRHSDGRAGGVVVIESHGLLHARLKASLVAPIEGLSSRPGTSLTRRAQARSRRT